MKTISSTLLAYLQTVTETYRADLLTLVLPNQQTIYAAMGVSDDVTWNGVTYAASASGVWTRSTQTSKADFSLGSNGLSLTVVALDSVLVPGTATAMMAVAQAGFFDNAQVTIDTVYMPIGQWNTIVGWMRLHAGTIVSATKLGRSKASFDVRDWLYLLNLKVPTKVIQPSCPHTLFDHGCTLIQSNYGAANNVSGSSTQTTLVPVSTWPTTAPNGQNPQAAKYFTQGKIQWTSGQNAQLWSSVAAYPGGAMGALTLSAAPPFPVAAGDSFIAYPGCDKSEGTCVSKFNNVLHFGGMPFVPVPERAI